MTPRWQRDIPGHRSYQCNLQILSHRSRQPPLADDWIYAGYRSTRQVRYHCESIGPGNEQCKGHFCLLSRSGVDQYLQASHRRENGVRSCNPRLEQPQFAACAGRNSVADELRPPRLSRPICWRRARRAALELHSVGHADHQFHAADRLLVVHEVSTKCF